MASSLFKNTLMIFVSLFLVVSPVMAFERFSSKECLESEFVSVINHQGPLFGLFKHHLTLDKKNCLIRVIHHKYITKEWKIDVCREPVHLKVTSLMGVDVAKKESSCLSFDRSKNTSDFCSQYYEMMEVLQDDGLIFAEGERDNIRSAHGRTYCTYLILQRYLADAILFSRYTETPNLFQTTTYSSPKDTVDFNTPSMGAAGQMVPASQMGTGDLKSPHRSVLPMTTPTTPSSADTSN